MSERRVYTEERIYSGNGGEYTNWEAQAKIRL